jgi:hypothetical protein
MTSAYDDSHFTPPAPVARVVTRHPDRGEDVGDIPMLIDSGADASLLPRSAVASLGIVELASGMSWWRSTERQATRRLFAPISSSWARDSEGSSS